MIIHDKPALPAAGPLPVSGGETPPAPAPPLGVAVAGGAAVFVAAGGEVFVAAGVADGSGVSVDSLRGGCVGFGHVTPLPNAENDCLVSGVLLGHGVGSGVAVGD